LIKFAYDNYLPAENKQRFALGLSNFKIVSANNSQKYAENCSGLVKDKRFCSSLINQTQTFFKYDMEIALKGILNYVQSQKHIIKDIEKLCPNFDKEVELAVKEFDPTVRIENLIVQKDLQAVDKNIGEISKKLEIELKEKRAHNPLAKSNPFAETAIYNGFVGDCTDGEKFNLNVLDKAQLVGLSLLNKVTNYFSPKIPKVSK